MLVSRLSGPDLSRVCPVGLLCFANFMANVFLLVDLRRRVIRLPLLTILLGNPLSPQGRLSLISPPLLIVLGFATLCFNLAGSNGIRVGPSSPSVRTQRDLNCSRVAISQCVQDRTDLWRGPPLILCRGTALVFSMSFCASRGPRKGD